MSSIVLVAKSRVSLFKLLKTYRPSLSSTPPARRARGGNPLRAQLVVGSGAAGHQSGLHPLRLGEAVSELRSPLASGGEPVGFSTVVMA